MAKKRNGLNPDRGNVEMLSAKKKRRKRKRQRSRLRTKKRKRRKNANVHSASNSMVQVLTLQANRLANKDPKLTLQLVEKATLTNQPTRTILQAINPLKKRRKRCNVSVSNKTTSRWA